MTLRVLLNAYIGLFCVHFKALSLDFPAISCTSKESAQSTLQLFIMRFSTVSVALGLLPLISSAPVPPPGILPLSASDSMVLQLALFLENLEYNLYTGGFENFTDAQYEADGFPVGFRENVGVIAEVTHILFPVWTISLY